jgi:hypothetical protein
VRDVPERPAREDAPLRVRRSGLRARGDVGPFLGGDDLHREAFAAIARRDEHHRADQAVVVAVRRRPADIGVVDHPTRARGDARRGEGAARHVGVHVDRHFSRGPAVDREQDDTDEDGGREAHAPSISSVRATGDARTGCRKPSTRSKIRCAVRGDAR